MPNGTRYQSTIVAAIVALILIAAATVVGIAITGHTSDSTPLVTQVLGFVALAVIALLGLLKAEKVEHKADVIQGEVNGRLDSVERKIETASENG